MADVFISYARADQSRVERLSAALEAAGLSVWWDRDIEAGAEFSSDIERELDSAAVAIVCWSHHAIKSAWVKDEAAAARDQGKLIPVALDDAQAPLGFRQYQLIDLSSWMDGGLPAALMQAVQARAGTQDGQSPPVLNAAGESQPPELSIAVLAFENMSSDPEQTYFSDGIAEEILGALAKLKNLSVAGRTSSFSFKGKGVDLRTIGRQLQVKQILEGSVRKQGNRVRIAAQLVRAENGFQLWSETYDRTLDDIFAIQDDIARAITDAMKIVLVDRTAPIVAKLTDDREAYDLYLQARSLIYRRGGENIGKAIPLLSAAVERDKLFARAWSALALAHFLAPAYGAGNVKENAEAVDEFAREALALDPALGEPHALRAVIALSQNRFTEMHEQRELALANEPDDLSTILYVGHSSFMAGDMTSAHRRFTRLTELDPAFPHGLVLLACTLECIGQHEEAERIAARGVSLGNPLACWPHANQLNRRGDHDGAVESLSRAMKDGFRIPATQAQMQILARGFYQPEHSQPAIDLICATMASGTGNVMFPPCLIAMGETEKAFEAMQFKDNWAWDIAMFMGVWGMFGSEARNHPAFHAYARKIGLLQFWRTHGFPANCRPSGKDEFDCDQPGMGFLS